MKKPFAIVSGAKLCLFVCESVFAKKNIFKLYPAFTDDDNDGGTAAQCSLVLQSAIVFH